MKIRKENVIVLYLSYSFRFIVKFGEWLIIFLIIKIYLELGKFKSWKAGGVFLDEF